MAFRILWIINALPAAIFVYFFIAGVADGTVSSANMLLWLMVLAACFAILAGSFALHKAGRLGLANLVLAPGAIGAVLAALFFMIVMGSGARWN